jgi:hypothetical protein
VVLPQGPADPRPPGGVCRGCRGAGCALPASIPCARLSANAAAPQGAGRERSLVLEVDPVTRICWQPASCGPRGASGSSFRRLRASEHVQKSLVVWACPRSRARARERLCGPALPWAGAAVAAPWRVANDGWGSWRLDTPRGSSKSVFLISGRSWLRADSGAAGRLPRHGDRRTALRRPRGGRQLADAGGGAAAPAEGE